MQSVARRSGPPVRRVLPAALALLAIVGLVAGVSPAPAKAAIALRFTTIATGISRPVALANAGDGSGRLFVVEQAGRVRVITAAGNLRATPFIDIRGRVACCGERGLLGIAFHPRYETNGRFYLSYTDADGALVVGEYRRTSSDRNRASTTERRIIRIPHPGHEPTTTAARSPSGRTGTSTSAPATAAAAATRARTPRTGRTLLGKILRIAPNVTSADARVPHPVDQPVQGPRNLPPGDLVVRPPQPVAVQLRPEHRVAVDRRRRPEQVRGGQPRPEVEQGREGQELRLGPLRGPRAATRVPATPRASRSRWPSTPTGPTAARSPAATSTGGAATRPSRAGTSSATTAAAGSGRCGPAATPASRPCSCATPG